MGYMLLHSVNSVVNTAMSGNPSKKIKLDFQNKIEGGFGNDDLWGQDDLTAEEFDMLEVQATQSCNQNYTFLNNTPQVSKSSTKQVNAVEVDDLKQLQYELEGRVKLLSHSLEKSGKELNEERLNREQIINERIKEFSNRESSLLKEIEKMHSILEFKEQEMKSAYSKLQVMKSQLQDRKCGSTEMSMNMNFSDFLKSSKCDGQFARCNTSRKFHRKHKILVDTANGEIKGIDILSSILCTRLAVPSFQSFESTINNANFANSLNKHDLNPMSVVQLKNGQKSDELMEFFSCFLRNHVTMLKTVASKGNVANSNKSSPILTKRKNADYSRTVISYLCDISYIYSCSSFNPSLQKYYAGFENPLENVCLKNEEKSLSNDLEGKVNVTESYRSLLNSLSALQNSQTYPIGYIKTEEMEFSLSALLTICLSSPEQFLELIGEFPSHFLLNPHESVTGLCTTLKLATSLCSCKKYASYFTHKNNNCIYCLIAAFLINVVPHYPEKFAISLTLIEDFLSCVFPVCNIKETVPETSDCISKVIQGIIKSLWKYYQLRKKINLSIEIIKKGFHLLHLMSCCIPNFKERRNQVEDEYISLISGILTISKENCELKECYDLIHSLWDFQTDLSEFDLEDFPEDVQISTNEIDVE